MTNRYPHHIERDFVNIYLTHLNAIVKHAKRLVMKAYNDEVNAELETDSIDDIARKLKAYAGKVSRKTLRNIKRTARELNAWNYARLSESVEVLKSKKRIDGIDISKASPEVDTLLDEFVTRNARLIRNIGVQFVEGGAYVPKGIIELAEDAVREDVAAITYEGVTRGHATRTLAKRIEDVTHATRKKAEFWARDQVGKALGEINRTRQTSAGFPGFVWMTSLDNAVRDTHAKRHGAYYEWATVDIIPGQDYRCRCDAYPAVSSDDALSDTMRERELRTIENERKTYAKEEREQRERTKRRRTLARKRKTRRETIRTLNQEKRKGRTLTSNERTRLKRARKELQNLQGVK